MTVSLKEGVVYLAGTEWDRVAATDRHLTLALAGLIGPSLYVDPVVSVTGAARRKVAGEATLPQGLSEVAPLVTRLRTFGPPLLTRRGVFRLTRFLQSEAVKRALTRCGIRPVMVVLATPWNTFPAGIPGTKVLFLTDDWEAGAGLMGTQSHLLGARLVRELGRADLACAVTPPLMDRLMALDSSKPVVLLPNGCTLPELHHDDERPRDLPEGPLVGLVGQVNERIDIALLESMVDRNMSLVVIGPVTCADPADAERYRTLFAREKVTWLGRLAPEELPRYLPHLTVGITPYLATDFNRSSFPLKTLEYLSYGLPVVATDLPATRWLDSGLLDVAETTEHFLELVAARYSQGRDHEAEQARRRLAGEHTWAHRAAQLRGVVDSWALSRA
jgi:teichuronic acid biosynthesis glycosyltransferase TuaH